MRASPRASWPVMLLGFGYGGLLDGIILHQLLQWHHLVSARVPDESLSGLRTNLFWDGILQLAASVVVFVAVVFVLREARARRSSFRRLAGSAMLGWGLFNVADELLFHLLFGLHHIREEPTTATVYDWWFLGFGLALVALGSAMLTAVEPARDATAGAGRRASPRI